MGGGFFGGSSSSNQQQTSSTSSPYAAPLAGYSQQLAGVGIPLATTAASQMMEALRTGGVNAFLPFITRAMDAVRQQGTQTIQNLRQALARSGFARTGMATSELAQANQAVNQQAALTPTDLIQQLITQAGPFGAQLTGAGLSGLSTAGGLTRTGTGTSTSTGTYDPGLLQWMTLGLGNPDMGGGIANSLSAPLGTFWNWFSGSGAPAAADTGAAAASNFASSGYDPFLWSGSPTGA